MPTGSGRSVIAPRHANERCPARRRGPGSRHPHARTRAARRLTRLRHDALGYDVRFEVFGTADSHTCSLALRSARPDRTTRHVSRPSPHRTTGPDPQHLVAHVAPAGGFGSQADGAKVAVGIV